MIIDKKISYPCFCVSNYDVIKSILFFVKKNNLTVIIESTSSQVNQFGGYTNKTPKQFKTMIYDLCKKIKFPLSQVILGGDHLGHFPWRKRKKKLANRNAANLVKACLDAGYKKIHIDTSHKLLDDFTFEKRKALNRSQELAKLLKKKKIFPIFGTEVPFPGSKVQKKIKLTSVNDLGNEIDFYIQSLKEVGLNETFACVVEPGMYFENYKIVKPKIKLLKKLKNYSNKKNFFYEAHSCDYQDIKTLRSLVKNNFKFLKVGPELTYFYSKALFKMEEIEKKLFKKKSNFKVKLLKEMKKNKKHWVDYYSKNPTENELICNKLDRMRYYLYAKSIQSAKKILKKNINSISRKNLNKYFKFTKKIDNQMYQENNFNKMTYFYLNKTLIKFYRASGFKII